MKTNSRFLSLAISAGLLVASSILGYAQSGRDPTVPVQTKAGRVEGSSIINRNDLTKSRDQDTDRIGRTDNRDSDKGVSSSVAQTRRDPTVPAQTRSGRVEGSSITNRDDQMKNYDRSSDREARSQKMDQGGGRPTTKNGDRDRARSQKMGKTGARGAGANRGQSGMGMSDERSND
jgi:hypothetical protein